jgi:protoheme IX farnesyltransferase
MMTQGRIAADWRLDSMRAYLELTKPRITWLILMSTGIGYWFGLLPGWSLPNLLHTLVGTALLASGTAALNQWYERDVDALMHRTQGRPLPAGRVRAGRALAFGVVLSAAGFSELWLAVNPLAALLGLFTLGAYLLLYTPLKRISPACTTVGAFSGAMPPLIGYAAAAGHLTAQAWVLYGILFLWQFPHFLSIAWIYREDYRRGGIAVLPVVRPEGVETARQVLIASLLLVPLSLAPGFIGMSGKLYVAAGARSKHPQGSPVVAYVGRVFAVALCLCAAGFGTGAPVGLDSCGLRAGRVEIDLTVRALRGVGNRNR